MQQEPEVPSAFDGNLQLAWDSTSLRALKKCPRYYYYTIVRGFRHKTPAYPLSFGILFHEAMQRYSREVILNGETQDNATLIVLRWLLPEANAKLRGAKNDRSPTALVRAWLWYLDRFREDHMETVALADGRPAVELSFRMALPIRAPGGQEYLYCGHIDRIARYAGQLYVLDYKTTTSGLGGDFFTRFSPDPQMSGYTIAGQVLMSEPMAGMVIDGVQTQVLGTQYERGFAPRPAGVLDEWVNDLAYWIKLAERYAADNYWPLNDTACHHYSGCSFRNVCSKAPAVRDQYLAVDYELEPWNPLKPRELD